MNKYDAIAAWAIASAIALVLVALIVCITVYNCVTYAPPAPVAAEAKR